MQSSDWYVYAAPLGQELGAAEALRLGKQEHFLFKLEVVERRRIIGNKYRVLKRTLALFPRYIFLRDPDPRVTQRVTGLKPVMFGEQFATISDQSLTDARLRFGALPIRTRGELHPGRAVRVGGFPATVREIVEEGDRFGLQIDMPMFGRTHQIRLSSDEVQRMVVV